MPQSYIAMARKAVIKQWATDVRLAPAAELIAASFDPLASPFAWKSCSKGFLDFFDLTERTFANSEAISFFPQQAEYLSDDARSRVAASRERMAGFLALLRQGHMYCLEGYEWHVTPVGRLKLGFHRRVAISSPTGEVEVLWLCLEVSDQQQQYAPPVEAEPAWIVLPESPSPPLQPASPQHGSQATEPAEEKWIDTPAAELESIYVRRRKQSQRRGSGSSDECISSSGGGSRQRHKRKYNDAFTPPRGLPANMHFIFPMWKFQPGSEDAAMNAVC